MKTLAPRPGLKQRLSARAPFNGPVEFRNGPDGLKKATYRNVGRGGICLESHEMLNPGDRVLLDFSRSLGEVGEAECLARVVWAQPTDVGCLAGVRIYHDEPSVAGTLSALVRQAVTQNDGSVGSKPPLWEAMTPYAMPPGYPGARVETLPESRRAAVSA
ncbi:MAG: PilZ domain-containing protein [Candidatus Hydrogenedentota bacterium]